MYMCTDFFYTSMTLSQIFYTPPWPCHRFLNTSMTLSQIFLHFHDIVTDFFTPPWHCHRFFIHPELQGIMFHSSLVSQLRNTITTADIPLIKPSIKLHRHLVDGTAKNMSFLGRFSVYSGFSLDRFYSNYIYFNRSTYKLW
jgi:hypothetical protein